MIITPSNFKGGVGKTTTSLLISYILSEHQDKTVLVVDTDPQENLTFSIATTFKQDFIKNKNIFNACFDNHPITANIQTVTNNLDILAGDWLMTEFELEAEKHYKRSQFRNILKTVLNPIINDYDYIIIDTSPYINLVMDNVINITDFVIITTQTVPMAFESTKRYYDYLLSMYEQANFELLGVLPYLVSNSATDTRFLQKYQEIFEEELFSETINHSDRVKTWTDYGITEDKPYDKRTLAMYTDMVDEMLQRITTLSRKDQLR